MNSFRTVSAQARPRGSPAHDGRSARAFLVAAGRRPAASGTPKYLGLVQVLEAGVRQGALAPGAQLPAQRDLAALFGTTVATVTKAVAEAARRGIVVARSGSGTFVAPSQRDREGEAWPDLSLNIPPSALCADLVSSSLRRVMQSAAASWLDYAPVIGSPESRMAGATMFAARGVVASAEQVLITQGAHQGLIAALMATTRPGDSIACERLNYGGLRRIAEMLQLRLLGIDHDFDGMVVSHLRARLRRERIKAVVCTPSGHNPTSFTLSERRRIELIRLARSATVPIIEDDIYGLLCQDGLPPLAALWPEGTLCVTSLSKSVAPGLRVGYVLGPSAWMPGLRGAVLALGWTESSLPTALATDLVQSGALAHCVQRHRAEARERFALAQRLLPAGSIANAAGSPSYHLWVRTGSTPADEVAAELLRRGVRVSPGSHFLVDDSEPPQALRVSLGGPSAPGALEGPLRELASVMLGGRFRRAGSLV